MRKFVILTLGLIALMSCTKQEQVPNVVNFGYTMNQGTSMYTKAFVSQDVVDAIRATLPTTIDLVVTSLTTNKAVTTKTGQGVVLAEDDYKVIGTYAGENTSGIISGTSAYLTHTPKVKINEVVSVEKETTDYTLSGKYDCFALVIDTDEVAKAEVSTMNGWEDVRFIQNGTMGLVYAQGDYVNTPCQIRLTPTDATRYEETTFVIYTTPKDNQLVAEKGKFYRLEPVASGFQPKIIGVDLPDFVEGRF